MRAGLDVSVTNGTLVVTDSTNTKLEKGEITHTSDGIDQTSWSFNWTAPSTYGNVTMYAAGNSVDGDGKNDADDLWNTTFLTIIVTIPGDVNGDKAVNILDVGKVNAYWWPTPPLPNIDYRNVDANGDGAINILDIGVVNGHWEIAYS